MNAEWEDLEPIIKTVPWVQASIHVNKDGKPRLRMFLSEAMLNACGDPKTANVQFGKDGDKVMLRLSFDGKGKFTVHSLGRGGSKIHAIPCKPPVPDGARDTEPCDVTHKDKASAIIILPLAAWEAQLNQPAP